MAIDPRAAVLLQGDMQAKWQTLHFLWQKRKFALCSDLSFRRYKGDDLRHSDVINRDTVVSKVGDTEFTITFHRDARYRIRAASAADCDLWVNRINEITSFLANLADFRNDDPAVAAAAATRLKLLLPALRIDALQLAALDASILPASVQLLSSPASGIGDAGAACLGYLAACACKGLDASSAAAALAPMIQVVKQAVARDSSRTFSFFRPLISVMGSEAGNIRAGLSKVMHGVLSSAHDDSLIGQLVATYSLLSVIVHCLGIADDVQCFPALLASTAVILRAGQVQAATHGRNPYAVELCKLDALKVLKMPHLTGDFKDIILESTQFLNGYLLQQVLSEAIPASEDTTSFLESLADSLEAVEAAHARPADPPLHPIPDDVVQICLRGDAAALSPSSWFEQNSKQRVIRVFLSSTFTDTVHERAVLLRCVHPAVQTYARKLNIEVVLSEMRFGIRKALSDDNKTSEVCMTELERCSEESSSMAYMLFVRNKYGFRPPPRKVPQVDMQAMLALLPPADRDVIHEFYELDENEVVTPQECYRTLVNMHGAADVAAAAYIQRNQSLIPNYWPRFAELQVALRKGALLHWPSARNELTDYRSQHPIRFFFFSVTEEEICRGLFWKEAADVERSARVFLRPIEAAGGGDLCSSDPNAKELPKYVDMSDKIIDVSAQDRLRTLRDMINQATSHAPAVVSRSDGVVEWQDGTGFHPKHAPHAIDLQKFAYSATVSIFESIDRANERLAVQPHPLMTEIIYHMKFARVRSCKFAHSNETKHVTTKLHDYLSSLSGPGHAFVINGASGSGKTYLMAEAADKMAHDLKSSTDAVIVRFLGTSPASSSLADLLNSLCQQLHAISSDAAALPSIDDVEKLKEYFENAMKTWQTGRLTVFLDSLDQLDDTFGGRKLSWLPTHGLSPNVRLVISTLPDEAEPADGKPFACLSILQKRFKDSPSDSAMVEVQPVDDVRSLLLHLLKFYRHKLTDSQLQVLVAAIKLSPKTQTPLVVTILAVRFSEWPSHRDLPPDNKNPDGSLFVDTTSVRALVIQVFKALEAKHGPELVRATLAFITLAKDGVSETELSEILSLDDDVLASVYEWWVTSVRTLPTNPLTMLLADLKPYLTMRGAASGSGGLMIRWYHRQFWEAAEEYFLQDRTERRLRHAQLGEFFSGTWAGRSKPYNDRLTIAVQKKVAGEVSGDRRVRAQPLCLREGKSIFETKGDAGAVNERRCREAAYHFIAAGMLSEAADELCSFEGICARARCGEGFVLQQQLMELGPLIREGVRQRDTLAAQALHQLRRVEHYARWLQKDMSAIVANPESDICGTCSHQPEVSLAREDIKAYWERTSAGVKFDSGSSFRSFVLGPVSQDFDLCRFELKHHKGAVNCVAYNFDSSMLASASGDKTVAIWDTKTGMVDGVLKGHTGEVRSVAWCMAPDNRQLLATGEMRLHALLMPHNSSIMIQLCLSNDFLCFYS